MTDRRANAHRVVEFIGLPGCGKTTVAKHLFSLNGEIPVRITSGTDRAYSKMETMRFAVRKFVPCAKIFFYLSVYVLSRSSDASAWSRRRWLRKFYKVYCRMLLSFFRRIADASASGEVVFLEHGPINVFWMIDLECGSREKLRRKIIQEIQRNFAVEYVYFDISPAAAARRLTTASGREQTPFDRMGEAERQAMYEEAEGRFPSLLRILENSGASCLVLDAEHDVEQKARMILSWLNLNSDGESARAAEPPARAHC